MTPQAYSPSNTLHRTAKAALVLFALSALWLARQPLLELLSIVKSREAIVAALQGYGVWGPALLGAIIALQVTVAVIPGHVLMIAGGYIYGFTLGFFITWVTTVAASEVNFYLARRAGKPVVYRLAPAKVVERWQSLARGKGFTFFFLTFILPIFPTDLMSYVAGFGEISPRRFLAANVLGRLPCALTMTLIGAYGLRMPPLLWVLVIPPGLAGLWVWKRYNRELEARFAPQGRG